MTAWSPEKLRDFFSHYDPNNANQVKAVDLLQKSAPSVMNDEAEWVKMYRTPSVEKEPEYDQIAADIIKDFEGFRSAPYLCPAGVWTIGYGSTFYPDGKAVSPQDPSITQQQAQKLLEYTLSDSFVPVLQSTIPTWGPMNDNQRAAIISFAYNLGAHFYGADGFNTITHCLSAQQYWPGVPDALMLYVNPGSSFEAGLRRRRSAEGQLWEGQGPYAR